MGAILPIRNGLVHESEVSLVNEGRWLQGVANALPAQVTCCELAEFPIDVWCELVESFLTALRPLGK